MFENPALLKRLAKYTVQQCFRNSVLEDYHASTIPDSHTGDFSDVVVRTPHVEIPWPVFRASTTRKWTWWCGTSSIRGCEYRESMAHETCFLGGSGWRVARHSAKPVTMKTW
jgi:hypothetical protein